MQQAQIEDLIRVRDLYNAAKSIAKLYDVDICEAYNGYVKGNPYGLCVYKREAFSADALVIEASEKPGAVSEMIEALVLTCDGLCSFIHFEAHDIRIAYSE